MIFLAGVLGKTERPTRKHKVMKRHLLPAAIALLAASFPAHAAIVLSGDFVNGTSTPTFTITEDIVLTVETDGLGVILVFDEWAPTDGTQSGVFPSPSPQSLLITQAGSGSSVLMDGFADHANFTVADISDNDGYMQFGEQLSVSAGEEIRILAGSYTFSSNADFNPALQDFTFEGNVFLTDGDGNRLTNVATVPEPSGVLLASVLGGLGLLRRRRR